MRSEVWDMRYDGEVCGMMRWALCDMASIVLCVRYDICAMSHDWPRMVYEL